MTDSQTEIPDVDDSTARRLSLRLMRRQAALGSQVAALFLVLVLGIPLMNAWWPAQIAFDVAGFPLPWLLLGLLFYPVCWALSYFFVQRSEEIEREDAEMMIGHLRR